MPWLPNFLAPSVIRDGLAKAAVLMEILSAPAFIRAVISSTEVIPPPTVSGINTLSEDLRTISVKVLRPSVVAVISNNTSSSAPCIS